MSEVATASASASAAQPCMIIDDMMSLIEYHDNLAFQVDIEAEESLVKLMTSSSSATPAQPTERFARAAKINAARADLIKRINLAKEANCNAFSQADSPADRERNLFAPGGGMLVYVPKAVVEQMVPYRDRSRQTLGTLVLFASNTDYYNTRFVDHLQAFTPRIDAAYHSTAESISLDKNLIYACTLWRQLTKHRFFVKLSPASCRQLNLKFHNIVGIQPDTFVHLSRLSVLNLNENTLTRIEKDTFKGLCALRVLEINSCSIESIEHGAFVHLKQLKNLDLSNNRLQRIDKDMFAGIGGQLDELNVNYSAIEIIEAGAFSHMSRLKKLDIGSNHLPRIDKHLFVGLGQLIELDLGASSIEHIEHGAFAPLGKLVKLDLSGSHLARIDKGLLDGLVKLGELNLGGCKVRSIEPGAFLPLKKLKTLWIQDAQKIDNFMLCGLSKSFLQAELARDTAAAAH